MKLLVLTQKVDRNDDLLGFFHGWLKELSQHFKYITVICLEKGEFDLPDNVTVLSLGKERGRSRIKYLYNFYRHICRLRSEYDAVFIHMNVEYAILGGLFWRLRRQPIYLWYTHRQVDWKLRLALFFSRMVFTASAESFGLKSPKVRVIGHGIDLEQFSPSQERNISSDVFRIICSGRISAIKNQKLLIETMDYLVNGMGLKNVVADLVGAPVYDRDRKYQEDIIQMINDRHLEQNVNLVGKKPNHQMPDYYRQSDLSINLCPTGGVDKAVLEALACGIPALVLNQTFLGIFGEAGSDLVMASADPRDIGDKIISIMRENAEIRIKRSAALRKMVENKFSSSNMMAKIASLISAQSNAGKFISRLKLACFQAIKAAYFRVATLFNSFGTAILMYHSVSDHNSVLFTVKPTDFKRQLSFLAKHRFNVVSMDHLLGLMSTGKEMPRKTVVLTFDDGYLDNYTEAWPLLKSFGFPATIFLPTGHIGKAMDNSQNQPLMIMDAKQIKELSASGLIEFGSHTHSHSRLEKISDDEFRHELIQSKKIIEDLTGRAPTVFAYPRGYFRESFPAILKECGFLSAVTVREGLVKASDDHYLLKRNFIYSGCGLSQFKSKLGTAASAYDYIKNIKNKL